jgi:hypothetical protein
MVRYGIVTLTSGGRKPRAIILCRLRNLSAHASRCLILKASIRIARYSLMVNGCCPG